MRILMIVPRFLGDGAQGGAEQQALKLIRALVSRAVEVKIVAGWWSLNEPRTEVLDGVPVHRVFTLWYMGGIRGLRRFSTYLYMLSLLYYLIRYRKSYDLIHVHAMSPSTFVAVVAGKLLGKKTISKVMAGSRWSDLKRMADNKSMVPGSRYMLPYIHRNVDRVIALNGEISQELVKTGFAPGQIVRIPNGVGVNTCQKLDYHFQSPARLVFVGRLQPQKGLDTLLEALAQLKIAYPDFYWQLEIFGEGPSRRQYETLTAELGTTEQVQFAGYVPDLLQRIPGADIFILPSRAEGMSNALLEAMAAGLPCIATEISGNTDLIQDGLNGLLVPPDDAEALATTLEKLLDSRSLREKLGRHARETVCQKYSIEAVANRYLELYQNLLGSSAGFASVSQTITR
jgi:glycosyltransferase involved in cell wall biosynthesis